MSQTFLDERRRALEDSFFRERDAELLKRLRNQLNLECKRHELAIVSGIHDKKLLDRLINLELGPETVAALSLVPMVRVAWADGKLDKKERNAILDAAVGAGLDKADPSYHWLSSWLESRPDDELIGAWTGYVTALLATLGDEDRKALRNGLLQNARQVAAAAGSILGLTDPISDAEEAVLKELDAALSGAKA
jgi:hypothetical protein